MEYRLFTIVRYNYSYRDYNSFVRCDFVDTFDGIVPCKGVEPTVQVQVVVTDTGVNVQVDM